MKSICKGKWKLCQNVEDVGHRVVYTNGECPRAIINLCETCKKCMPSCGAEEKDVKFGDGLGNDNIYECSKYDKAKELTE